MKGKPVLDTNYANSFKQDLEVEKSLYALFFEESLKALDISKIWHKIIRNITQEFTRVPNLKDNAPLYQLKTKIKGVTVSPVFLRSKQDTFPVFTHYLVCVGPQVYTLF